MCSIVGPIMDNRDYYQGDLSDIIRASYGSCSTGTSSSEAIPFSSHHWMFLSDPLDLSCALEDPRGNFGDPFSNSRDPFLHELDMPAGSAYFNSSSGSAEIGSSGGLEEAATCFGGAVIGSSDTCVLAQEIVEDYDMRRPNNIILSSMIQISPKAKLLPISTCDSPVMPASPLRVVKPSAVVSGNIVNANNSKDHCLVENTGVQISSPRNPAGLKRRKSQAKKSICIPAPAAPNRQSGEVVPSDLWAWRKYGQKPIKGSPHPRGYYRCSSSKGCPARKQVERSRTDPNMLVITYTSEHNHPWPTQRNALAGSSRSQPSKKINNNAASKNSETSQTTEPHKGTTTKTQEEEQQSNSNSNVSPVVAAGNSANSASVKEENIDGMEKQLEMDDGEFSNGVVPYKTSNKMKCNNQLEDFFAELGEMEADDDDSLNLLCAQGFGAVDDQQRESKVLDPFHVLDWSEDNSTRYYLTRTT